MKKPNIKSILIVLSIALSASVLLTACGAVNKINEEDAYNWGYYTGRAIRSMVDN